MNIRLLAASAALCLLAAGVQAFAQTAPAPLTTIFSGSHELLRDFQVEQPAAYAPGARLFFTAHGEPGARATVTLANARGASQSLALAETAPGTYEGFYTVKPYDDFSAPAFSAKLDKRGRSATAVASAYVQPAPAPAAICQTCGSISSIQQAMEGSPEANVAGAVAGGIIGGALGDSLAGRHEHGAGTLLGAIIGSGVGSQVGQSAGSKPVWLITVALDNGASQTFKSYNPPSAGVGARVRVENGQLMLDHP